LIERWRLPYRTTLTILGGTFAVVFVVLAIDPVSRATWWIENLLVFAIVPGLILTYRAFRFSRLSYTCIFVFLCLHEIGAHYTYSLVPYDEWTRSAFGFSLNEALGFERNHYDRAIHFAYGLLMAYPIREVFLRVVNVRGFWGYFLPLDLTMSSSMVFELIEWAVAGVFGGDVGQEYLGMQGDVWDAQKDMALASAGAVLAMGLTLAFNLAWQRDFAAEWADSFRVKHPEPLGEDAIAGMLRTPEEGEGAPTGPAGRA
jgi:putative membrane protein